MRGIERMGAYDNDFEGEVLVVRILVEEVSRDADDDGSARPDEEVAHAHNVLVRACGGKRHHCHSRIRYINKSSVLLLNSIPLVFFLSALSCLTSLANPPLYISTSSPARNKVSLSLSAFSPQSRALLRPPQLHRDVLKGRPGSGGQSRLFHER